MILTSLCKWGCTGVAPGLTGGARATPGTPLAPPLSFPPPSQLQSPAFKLGAPKQIKTHIYFRRDAH